MTAYLRLEGVNLGNIFGDTQQLSIIRGGSFLISNSVPDVAQEFASSLDLIFSDASSGVFSVKDSAKSEETAEAVRAFLRSGDRVYGTFVVDTAEGDPAHFEKVCAELLAKNRRRQMGSLSVALDPVKNAEASSPSCLYCHVRPGDKDVYTPEGNVKVCSACSARLEIGRKQKTVFYAQQIYGDPTAAPQHDFARSFEEIAKIDATVLGAKGISTRLADKIALIYIDGNKIGSRMRALSGDDVKTASDHYRELRRSFLKSFLDIIGKDPLWIGKRPAKGTEEAGMFLRLELLMWGGDEMTLVVPAWKGWETLAFFYQCAKDWELPVTVSDTDAKLTHAAGVVFCGHKTHIHRQIALVHRLAETVKSQASPGNRFACQVVKSFDYADSDLAESRDKMKAPGEPPEALLLNGEKMAEVQRALLPALRRRLSRKLVYSLAEQLAADGAGIKALLAEAQAASGDMAACLDECLVTGDSKWIHLRELWDYIPECNGQ